MPVILEKLKDNLETEIVHRHSYIYWCKQACMQSY